MNAEYHNINSGISQGDSLFPILYWVALIPLSKLLNNTRYGNKIYDNAINLLLYGGLAKNK